MYEYGIRTFHSANAVAKQLCYNQRATQDTPTQLQHFSPNYSRTVGVKCEANVLVCVKEHVCLKILEN